MVAKGFMQKIGESYIDSYAPVSSFDSLRFVLSYAAVNSWFVNQVDVKTAFLNGKLDHPVYFKPPFGSGTDTSNYVWLLHRSLYGLATSSAAFWSEYKKALEDIGFESSKVDPCLFFKEGCMFLVYVDDGCCCGATQEIVDDVISKLSQRFMMKDLGAPSVFLGINIDKVSNVV
ncbi:unnamed protein product [Ambrosiozyma monospora]|uniref:Unnamed protein product n=1 Tax=Ambrosiozyma monospora TaxID=43982 RepID=A0ACB5SX09_AMBMO|nr:unnamed protein product [Ambrosiozyma monospora]